MDRLWRSLRRPCRELLAGFLDLALPVCCVACGRGEEELCPVCAAGLGVRKGGCPRCGEAVGPRGRCAASHRDLAGLAVLAAPFAFAGTGGVLVRRFKLDADPSAGRFLVRAMRRYWAARHAEPWRRAVVVPVPLHPKRLRDRGFNQAAWLAGKVGERFGLAVEPDLLRRIRPTRAQGDPRTLSRERNVEGAFAGNGGARMAGKSVVLVDDVFTSGATMRECARVLRACGVRRIAALTACRS